MRVVIYNENCIMAGQQAYAPENRCGGNWPHDNDDLTVYEGSLKELAAQAAEIFSHAQPDAAGSYQRQVAQTLTDAVGWLTAHIR